MGQYFFDFRDIVPGIKVPPGFVRLSSDGEVNSNWIQSFLLPGDGCEIWLRNSAAGTGNYTDSCMLVLDGVTAVDCECLVKAMGIVYTGGNFNNDGPSFYPRLSSATANVTGYQLALSGSLGDSGSYFRKRISSSNTALGVGSGGIKKTAPFWTRYQISGNNLRVRSWADGEPEPATWGHSIVDSSISTEGYMAFGFPGASGLTGTQYWLFQLSFGTHGDPAPSSILPRFVSGTLLKPDGNAAAGYLVRCYARETGALLGETLTNSIGAFVFSMNYSKQVYCIGIDQLGNAWKAPIIDRVSPSAA